MPQPMEKSSSFVRDMLRIRFEQMPGQWAAVHELNVPGASQVSVARRLYEMKKFGTVVNRTREGTRFKEWAMPG